MNRIYHDRDTSTSDYREKHRDWQPEAAGPPAGFKFRVTVLTVGVAVTAVTHRAVTVTVRVTSQVFKLPEELSPSHCPGFKLAPLAQPGGALLDLTRTESGPTAGSLGPGVTSRRGRAAGNFK